MISIKIIEEGNEIADLINNCKNHIYDCKDYAYDIIIDNSGKCHEGTKSLIYMINSDENLKDCNVDSSYVISYGLNSLATVTASSIFYDGDFLCFQYCLQREIISLSGKKTEPQEFSVRVGKEIKIHSALAFVTYLIINESKNDENLRLLL